VTSGRIALIMALAVVAMSACTVDPAASGVGPTPTLNPNQLEALRRSAGLSPTPMPTTGPVDRTPGATGSPLATSVPIVTPAPTPYDADLEAMLPTSIREIPLARFSTPVSAYAGGGDMCSLLCPDEPARLAEVSGVALDDIGLAVAYPDASSGLKVGILALRFPGIATSRLVDIRIEEGGTFGPRDGFAPATRTFEIGSRTVTHVAYPPFYQPELGEYLMATDDVLFIVVGSPPSQSGTIPADIRLAIEALP
jgi:hypothetical protein